MPGSRQPASEKRRFVEKPPAYDPRGCEPTGYGVDKRAAARLQTRNESQASELIGLQAPSHQGVWLKATPAVLDQTSIEALECRGDPLAMGWPAASPEKGGQTAPDREASLVPPTDGDDDQLFRLADGFHQSQGSCRIGDGSRNAF
jgi:hypothetical protein